MSKAMHNSFQQWALPRLERFGIDAFAAGNWIKAKTRSGDWSDVMTYSGVTSFILDNAS